MAVSTQVRIPLVLVEEYQSLKLPKDLNVTKASFPDFVRNAIVEKLEKLKETAAKEKR